MSKESSLVPKGHGNLPIPLSPDNSKTKEYRRGRIEAIKDLLDAVKTAGKHLTIEDIEWFQKGQLLDMDELTDKEVEM